MTAPAFTAADVRAVTGDVWESWLASSGDLLEDGTGAPLVGEVAQASVRIAWGWDGAVTLEMSTETALAAARVMLPDTEVGPAEVADAVAELVNVIGGNLKSLLPTPARLGLPQVVRVAAGADLEAGHVPPTEHQRVDLSWGTRPVLVRVWS